jgi:hypothetical protein
MLTTISDTGCTFIGHSYDIAVSNGVSSCPQTCRCDACTGRGAGPRDAIAFCGRQIDNGDLTPTPSERALVEAEVSHEETLYRSAAGALIAAQTGRRYPTYRVIRAAVAPRAVRGARS